MTALLIQRLPVLYVNITKKKQCPPMRANGFMSVSLVTPFLNPSPVIVVFSVPTVMCLARQYSKVNPVDRNENSR